MNKILIQLLMAVATIILIHLSFRLMGTRSTEENIAGLFLLVATLVSFVQLESSIIFKNNQNKKDGKNQS